jgi:hypothetical protein
VNNLEEGETLEEYLIENLARMQKIRSEFWEEAENARLSVGIQKDVGNLISKN